MKMSVCKIAGLILFLSSCTSSSSDADATGNFETDETIVSAEATGKILMLSIQEGQLLEANQVLGYVDTIQLYLKKKQTQYAIQALLAKRSNTSIQLSALQEQLAMAIKEKNRVEHLFNDSAATQKQLDDSNAQVLVLQKQIDALNSSLSITNASLHSETLPLKAQVDQIQDQIKKSVIVNPIAGTVLTQYALQNEVVNSGKALYKIADLSTLTLRAYLSGNLLPEIKIGQQVKVNVDASGNKYKSYEGIITWV